MIWNIFYLTNPIDRLIKRWLVNAEYLVLAVFIGTAIVKWLKFMIIPGTVDLSWNSLKRFLWTYQDCFHGNHPGIILNLKKEQFMVIYYIIYLHSKMKDWEMKIDWLIFIGRVIDLQSDINQYWPIRMEYSVYWSAN